LAGPGKTTSPTSASGVVVDDDLADGAGGDTQLGGVIELDVAVQDAG